MDKVHVHTQKGTLQIPWHATVMSYVLLQVPFCVWKHTGDKFCVKPDQRLYF